MERYRGPILWILACLYVSRLGENALLPTKIVLLLATRVTVLARVATVDGAQVACSAIKPRYLGNIAPTPLIECS